MCVLHHPVAYLFAPRGCLVRCAALLSPIHARPKSSGVPAASDSPVVFSLDESDSDDDVLNLVSEVCESSLQVALVDAVDELPDVSVRMPARPQLAEATLVNASNSMLCLLEFPVLPLCRLLVHRIKAVWALELYVSKTCLLQSDVDERFSRHPELRVHTALLRERFSKLPELKATVPCACTSSAPAALSLLAPHRSCACVSLLLCSTILRGLHSTVTFVAICVIAAVVRGCGGRNGCTAAHHHGQRSVGPDPALSYSRRNDVCDARHLSLLMKRPWNRYVRIYV
jgi:hypothetical protein